MSYLMVKFNSPMDLQTLIEQFCAAGIDATLANDWFEFRRVEFRRAIQRSNARNERQVTGERVLRSIDEAQIAQPDRQRITFKIGPDLLLAGSISPTGMLVHSDAELSNNEVVKSILKLLELSNVVAEGEIVDL